MTLHVYHQKQHVASYQGDEYRLQSLGEVIEDLYPNSLIVLSDEDDLTDEQVQLLNEIADYQLELMYHQPACQ